MGLCLTFMKERYDREVEVHHLCPRHAYDICDPAGGRYVIPNRLCRGVQVSQATTLMIFTVLGSSYTTCVRGTRISSATQPEGGTSCTVGCVVVCKLVKQRL